MRTRVVDPAVRIVGMAGVITAALVALGLAWVAARGGSAKVDAASFVFIGGALIVLFALGSGGGTRGQRNTVLRGRNYAPTGDFAWLFTGLGVIGLGVLAVWLWP